MSWNSVWSEIGIFFGDTRFHIEHIGEDFFSCQCSIIMHVLSVLVHLYYVFHEVLHISMFGSSNDLLMLYRGQGVGTVVAITSELIHFRCLTNTTTDHCTDTHNCGREAGASDNIFYADVKVRCLTPMENRHRSNKAILAIRSS